MDTMQKLNSLKSKIDKLNSSLEKRRENLNWDVNVLIRKVKALKKKLTMREFYDLAASCGIYEKPVMDKFYNLYLRGELG